MRETVLDIERIALILRDENVTAVEWSHDGRYLAVLENYNSLVTIWDARAWKLLHSLSLPKYGGFPLRFTPDSRRLIVSSTRLGRGPSALSVVDVASGAVVRQVKGPNPIDEPDGWAKANIPLDIAISEDGHYAFVNHVAKKQENYGVYVYETKRWSIVAHLRPQGGVMCMAAGPGVDQLVTCDSFGALQVWRMPEGVLIKEMSTGFCSCRKIAIDAKRRRLIAGQWEYKTRRDEATNELVSYDERDTIRIWDLDAGDCLGSATMSGSVSGVDYAAGVIVAVVRSPQPRENGAYMEMERRNLLYRADDLRQIASLRSFSDTSVGAARFRPDGGQLAIAGDAQVTIYSLASAARSDGSTASVESPAVPLAASSRAARPFQKRALQDK